MSVAAWSLVWQVVLAGTLIAFFGLAAWLARGALADLGEVFRDLRRAADPRDGNDRHPPPP